MTTLKTSIMTVDDEEQIRKMLKIMLEAEGYKVEPAEQGKQAVYLAASLKPHLILLDLGLPDMDGLDVIPQIREWSKTPIIVVSVRDDDETIAKALDLGADDYITKPFNAAVLMARIRANLRKMVRDESLDGESTLTNGKIRMDLIRHEVFYDNEKVDLSPREYNLLKFLMNNKGKMLTHKHILKEVWGPANVEDTQYLRVYVGQLRKIIEPNADDPDYIVTEPGIGYRMEEITPSASAA